MKEPAETPPEVPKFILELREARAKREKKLLDRLNEIRRRANDSTHKSN